MRCPFFGCIVAPSCVDLIPGASRAFILSDVATGAARGTDKLRLILAGWETKDRDPPSAWGDATGASMPGPQNFYTQIHFPCRTVIHIRLRVITVSSPRRMMNNCGNRIR